MLRNPRTAFSKPQCLTAPHLTRRSFAATSITNHASGHNRKPSSISIGSTPSPPRLPEEEQKIFEELQRQSAPPPLDMDAMKEMLSADAAGGEQEQVLHRDAPRNKAKPEFEGDSNPRTGEVGGPKNEPLKWGARGDWSYNGRVSDF